MSESACGKASSGNAPENNEFFCEICDREFNSQAGLNSHMGHTHPDEVRCSVECDWCGSDLSIIKSEVERFDTHFCDQDCKGNYWSENNRGEKHPRYNRVEVTCSYCGESQQRIKSQLDYNEYFCDQDCNSKYVSENGLMDGKNNPAYNSDTIECEHCGDRFTKPVSVIEEGRKFCDKGCMYKYISENYSGEDHWAYNGYYEESYGDEWDEKRLEARKRDNYVCQGCGIDESELDRELDVHHITPLRQFDSHEEANKLDNLVSLCGSCHSKWEGIPLRPYTG